MKYVRLVTVMIISATAQAADAQPAQGPDYMRVCEQIMEAFKDCGYPDPGIAQAGGCTEDLGKAWAPRLEEQILENKARLASMQGSTTSDKNLYQQLSCVNSKYEAINAKLK